MKSNILMVVAVLLFAGCDTPSGGVETELLSSASVSETLDLPTTTANYSDTAEASLRLLGEPDLLSNTDPILADSPFADEQATLGRVLFYETNLSRNGTVSCASCHKQDQGFSDNVPFSPGFEGELTARNSMSVANVRFYRSGRMFWDERAENLREQALIPIEHPAEMGLPLDEAVARIDSLAYYDALFTQAFGTPRVTADRIARAIARFERSIVSTNSKFDLFLAQGSTIPPAGGPGGIDGGPGRIGPQIQPGNPRGLRGGNRGGGTPPEVTVNPAQGIGTPNSGQIVFSPQEELGMRLFFSRRTQCSTCHRGNTFVGDIPRNNGLDIDTSDDEGAGDGRFKMASLRNIELTAPYMHDGRFETLREVVEHYNSGIQPHPALDNRLRNRAGQPIRMNLSNNEIDALVAFMRTLTDDSLALEERFSDPFIR